MIVIDDGPFHHLIPILGVEKKNFHSKPKQINSSFANNFFTYEKYFDQLFQQ